MTPYFHMQVSDSKQQEFDMAVSTFENRLSELTSRLENSELLLQTAEEEAAEKDQEMNNRMETIDRVWRWSGWGSQLTISINGEAVKLPFQVKDSLISNPFPVLIHHMLKGKCYYFCLHVYYIE